MKIKLLLIDEEEMGNGWGFMKRIKGWWDTDYLEHAATSMPKLRDNASRFKREPEIKNLLLVRKRSEVDHHHEYKQREQKDQNMVQEFEVTQDDEQETETAVTDVNADVNNEQRLRKEK